MVSNKVAKQLALQTEWNPLERDHRETCYTIAPLKQHPKSSLPNIKYEEGQVCRMSPPPHLKISKEGFTTSSRPYGQAQESKCLFQIKWGPVNVYLAPAETLKAHPCLPIFFAPNSTSRMCGNLNNFLSDFDALTVVAFLC